jgi:tetratricopeptide (TPR) repeat protein
VGTIEKTVFISYRRATGSGWALAIFQNLTSHGYDVFFDYHSIAGGAFEQVLLENVRARAHFLVLLTPSALEGVDKPGDWLRREIETALEHRRNIVPLMLEGFDFTTPSIRKHLIVTLAPLKDYNGLTVPVEYFDEAMNRLRTRYLNVAIDAVLHPVSQVAAQAASKQRLAAQAAPAVRMEELTADRYFELGIDAPDLETKVSCYTEATRLRPDFAEAYENRGAARQAHGDRAGALIDYAHAARAYKDRGIARQKRGDVEGAVSDFGDSIRFRPEDAELFRKRALARLRKDDLDGALQDYGEVIRLIPDDAQAYADRAMVRRRKGDYEGASADYREATRRSKA